MKIFFLVEKAIDISRFMNANGKKFVLSEIGRNFDYNWKRKKEIIICSSRVDPIKKFDKAIYRIRFTTFREEDFHFMIKIHSKDKINFLEKYTFVE